MISRPAQIRADGHEEWLTPKWLIDVLGTFDLDPCAPIKRPWDMARRHFTLLDNGLIQPWDGRVWLNPPYGNQAQRWMSRMAEHGNGIALLFARTDTKMFFEYVWPCAGAVMFLEGRLFFCYVDGRAAKQNAGAPSCLVAYGEQNVAALIAAQRCVAGHVVILNHVGDYAQPSLFQEVPSIQTTDQG